MLPCSNCISVSVEYLWTFVRFVLCIVFGHKLISLTSDQGLLVTTSFIEMQAIPPCLHEMKEVCWRPYTDNEQSLSCLLCTDLTMPFTVLLEWSESRHVPASLHASKRLTQTSHACILLPAPSHRMHVGKCQDHSANQSGA